MLLKLGWMSKIGVEMCMKLKRAHMSDSEGKKNNVKMKFVNTMRYSTFNRLELIL
jgi:hypothetical protein